MMFNGEKNKHYEINRKYWDLVRDFVEGKDAIKQYLRTLNQTDITEANTKRNKEYKDGAVYMNVASRTKTALVGAVFRKDPVYELPTQVEYMIENANGSGLSLVQVAKVAVSEVVSIGRYGLLVDYTMIETENATLEYVQMVGAEAKITAYTAEAIHNWKCDDNGRVTEVVLCEGGDDYRVLKYDDLGYYIQEVYEDGELKATFEPKMYDGQRWTEIPFVFVGSQSNTPHIDPITLLDIVNVSRGHFQNSADYEDFLHYLAPTFAATVPDKQWMDEMLPNGYNIGARGFIPIPEGGTAMILQAQPTNAHQEAMKHKEDQMILIGARLIESGNAAETAEAVRIRYSGENSILDNIAQNVSEAIEDCLEFVCLFMGGDTNAVSFNLNRDFFDTSLSPQEIMAMVQLNDTGVIAISDLRSRLRKSGYIETDRTDDDIKSELSNQL